MAGNIKEINDDAEFQLELTNAGTKLVVVDFFATWCGPCQRIAPFFKQLASKYPKTVFLKVDVDKCAQTAESAGVSAMPTFVFYRNKTKLELLRGADQNALEAKVKSLSSDGADGDDAEECVVKGHMDLSPFINKSGCECLNESDEHPLAHCLTPKGGYLESDCDEQLIITIEFNQAVKLHSLRIQAPVEKGPKTVKVFQNLPQTLDFDSAISNAPTQALEVTEDDIKNGSVLPLRFVKFQNVSSITLFIKDNQNGEEVTQLDYLGFIGSPVSTTNMAEFKRVAGKKGESH